MDQQSKTRHLQMATMAAVAAMMTFLLIGTAVGKYSGGTGEPNDPYRIATAADLNDIGNYEEDWNKHFILVSDVNLAEYTGTQFNIIGADWSNAFTGVFDGNDHKIWNFTWSSTDRDYTVGLFGYVGRGGQIKNLGMENIDVNAVNGSYIGGLAGYNYYGTISNCYSTGSVSGTDYVGGLAGFNHYGSRIAYCYSKSSILGYDYVGGLAGNNQCSISNCYSTGSVGGDEQVGGLVGINSGHITNCYSTGRVTANYEVGGLAGFEGGVVENSFWDIETSGQLTSAGGEPKTTAEMKTMSTFTDAGWDFIEIWGIGENQTYPFLRNEPAGDSNHDKKVDLLDLAILASHWLEER